MLSCNVMRCMQLRMPCGMQGSKAVVLEGGIRNFLAVQGPGVEASVTDSTLLDDSDILPTLTDLEARSGSSSSSSSWIEIKWSSTWDGISFANLLTPRSQSNTMAAAAAAAGADELTRARGAGLASEQQQERFISSFGHQCWAEDALPLLRPDRCALLLKTAT
jgi:arylsulfatase A-like enzyme